MVGDGLTQIPMCVCVCACACVRVRVCARVCACACVCACVGGGVKGGRWAGGFVHRCEETGGDLSFWCHCLNTEALVSQKSAEWGVC